MTHHDNPAVKKISTLKSAKRLVSNTYLLMALAGILFGFIIGSLVAYKPVYNEIQKLKKLEKAYETWKDRSNDGTE